MNMKEFWGALRRRLPSGKVFFLSLLALGAVLGILGTALIIYLAKDLPSLEQIDSRQVSQSTKIYDRTGKVALYELSGGQRRTVVPLADIPTSLKNATIAIEDERFYTEPAFDWRAILRAVLVNLRLREGYIGQGASTITQQLARNAFLTIEKTPVEKIARKIRELILAIYLNQHYTKDQILWLYLNEIPYGSTFYGVEAAAQAFFGKPAKELSLPQSAVIAALPQAPTYYSPWGTHTDALFARQRNILRKMRVLGMISEDELNSALAEKIEFAPQTQGIKAPHFTLMVQDLLVRKYGEDVVRRGGLTVITSLDANLQKIAERVVEEGAERNEELYGGKNAALVAQDPKTGQMLALVGSRDYFDIENEGNFNAAAQGLRQPGSALKPFAYLALMKQGYLPETVLFDAPTEFTPNNPLCPVIPNYAVDGDDDCFHPQNFDHDFRGPVSIRNALAQSVNIPAVKTLYLAGMSNVLQTLADFGITTLTDPSRYGLSLVLGGGEVHLTELVGAYAALANDGTGHEQQLILEIRDASGKVIESFTDRTFHAADPQVVRTITDILTDTDARAGLFGGSMNLTVFEGHDVALKTGTSNDYHDAWALGYTPSLAVGVWAGNNNNAAMHRQGSSILAAVPIWSAFLEEALADMSTEEFPAPEPQQAAKPFFAGTYMENNLVHSELFWVDRRDPAGPKPTDPTRDPQFNNWELGVLGWTIGNPEKLLQSQFGAGNAAGSSTTPSILMHSPQPGSFAGSEVTVWARVDGVGGVTRVWAEWNGALVQERIPPPNTPGVDMVFSFVPGTRFPQNALRVFATDLTGASSSREIVLYNNITP